MKGILINGLERYIHGWMFFLKQIHGWMWIIRATHGWLVPFIIKELNSLSLYIYSRSSYYYITTCL